MSNGKIYIFTVLCVAAVVGSTDLYGQKYPERRHIRAGNLDYEAQDYPASEGDYRTALERDSSSFAARFNLGDALYKQERFEEAEEAFASLAENPSGLSTEQAAKVFYNLGNAQFGQQKLKEALESYKMSLRVNPADLEAKYNLAYVQKLLEEQENQGGGGGDNQDNQDQQEQQDQQQNQNDNSRGEQEQDSQGEKDDQNQQEGQNDGEKDNREQQDQPNEGENDGEQDERQDKPEPSGEGRPTQATVSREDAEKMLQTIQSQEDKTREKVNEQQEATVGRSGKNW